jgi:hypothetical protein
VQIGRVVPADLLDGSDGFTTTTLGSRMMPATGKSLTGPLPLITLVVGALIGSVALPSQNVANAESRRIPRWCASMGGDFGFDCSYDTFAQCMETARGLGNYCLQNPRLPAGNRPVRQQRR